MIDLTPILRDPNTALNSNYGLFTNVQSYYYWSGVEYAPSTGIAWVFDFNGGYQLADDKNGNLFVWAVRSGDVAAPSPSVPEPGTLWLLGVGLVGLVSVRRRRR